MQSSPCLSENIKGKLEHEQKIKGFFFVAKHVASGNIRNFVDD